MQNLGFANPESVAGTPGTCFGKIGSPGELRMRIPFFLTIRGSQALPRTIFLRLPISRLAGDLERFSY
jgi:hypothetical protein